MLEKELVQYRGFHNIVENGEVTGFQVCVRQLVYRGAWLSQVRFGGVDVDDITYGPDVCTFVISGIEYTLEEMAPLYRVKWPVNEVCTIRVKKPGGLSQGAHKVNVRIGEVRSYLPPRIDSQIVAKPDPNQPSMFGGSNERELIIV